jgi:hypothetical protein
VATWSEWSGCSATCGGGVSTRSLDVTTEPENNGASCASLNGEDDEQACNTADCPVPMVASVVGVTDDGCGTGDWGPWSGCPVTCGDGVQTRTFESGDSDDGPCVGDVQPQPCSGGAACVYGRVTCTFTVDNVVDEVVVNGVDLTADILPQSCLANWRTDCTLEFDDTFDVTDTATQFLAVAGHEIHSSGCQHSGLALSCVSTHAASPWNGFASSASAGTWTARSTSTAFELADDEWCVRGQLRTPCLPVVELPALPTCCLPFLPCRVVEGDLLR